MFGFKKLEKMVKFKVARGLFRWYLLIRKAHAAFFPWGTVYFLNKRLMKERKLITHEMKHHEQLVKEGIFGYAIKYYYFFIKYGYYNNPYEREARRVMGINNKKQYLKYKKYLNKLR
jgi:hypothetical protein